MKADIFRNFTYATCIFLILSIIILPIKDQIISKSNRTDLFVNKSQYNLNFYDLIHMDIAHFNIMKEDVNKLKVGIIDSGFNNESSNLNLIFLNKSPTSPSELHGNIVSSIIGSRENLYNDFTGFFPNMELYVYDIEDQMSITNLTNALNVMIENGVNVINISLSTTKYDEKLYNAIKRAIKQGITIIASSGNSGDDRNLFPAAFDIPGVISVGATDRYNNILKTSTVNARVDIWAPGENISSIERNSNNINTYSGTSVSTPIITCLVILLKIKYPELSPEQVDDIIKKGTIEYVGKWGIENKTIRLVNFEKTLEICDTRKR